jgi:hypothetical protein
VFSLGVVALELLGDAPIDSREDIAERCGQIPDPCLQLLLRAMTSTDACGRPCVSVVQQVLRMLASPKHAQLTPEACYALLTGPSGAPWRPPRDLQLDDISLAWTSQIKCLPIKNAAEVRPL